MRDKTALTSDIPAQQELKTAYGVLGENSLLSPVSPGLLEMTTSWGTPDQWWSLFSVRAPSLALTQCPTCKRGQRVGVIEATLPEPGVHNPQVLRTFQCTFPGHPHALGYDDNSEMLLIRDITQECQKNDSVTRTIGHYESICNFIEDVYYRIDMQGNILFLSPSCRNLLLYAPTELLGTPFQDLTSSPESLNELLEILQKTNAVHDFYLLLSCKKGKQIPVSLTAKLVFGPQNQRLAIEGIFRDISERERLDTMLEERTLSFRESLSRLEDLKLAMEKHAMVTVSDPDGTILSVSDTLLETSRYSQHDLLGKNHSIFNSGFHPKAFFREMWHTITNGNTWRGEIRNRKKNGDFFWINCSIIPFLTPLGRPFQYISIATDISEWVHTRMRLERNRDFVHRVIHSMGEGVMVLDLQGRLLTLNQEGERLLGWREAELMHKNIHDITHYKQPDGKIIPSHECAVHQSLLGRAFRMDDDHFIRKDGSFLPVSHVTTPLKEGKEIIGSIAIFRDNSRFRQRSQELEHVRDSALESSRLKSEFLANMSHEIRTPMNAIIGMNDLLMDTPLNEEQVEFSEIIRDSAQSLLSLINDILDFSKIEAGKIDIEEIDFSPVTVLEGSAELLTTQAHEKGLSLTTFISPRIPKTLRGDPGRLRQMLLNLINNAIKFTEEGEVVVRAQVENEYAERIIIQFSVTDTGIGLPEQVKTRLFEPFTQADRTTSRKYGGTGLGLAISKQLTELMQGSIGVDTEVGEGTSFWFRIPFVYSELPDHSDDELFPPHYFQDKRIVTLMESQSDHDILENYFRSWRLAHRGTVGEDINKTTLLKSATSPWSHSTDQPFVDVAVINLNPLTPLDLPNFQLYNSEEGENLLKSTRLIALLDTEDKQLRESALTAGFSACLTKPVRQEQWKNILSDLLAHPTEKNVPKPPPKEELPQPIKEPVESSLDAYDALESGELLLLVEDNPVNQKVTLLQLKKLGYAAHAVNNGREAVEAVSHLPYALILMDCQMPVMDGFEATHAIRKMDRYSSRHIPIIAMTANAMKGDRERCLQAGMDDYLSKPVPPEIFLNKLQYWIPRGSNEMPPIEIHQLRQLFGNDDAMIRELLQHFPSLARELLDRLWQSIRANDKQQLNDTAFELKEACSNMGATAMAQLAHTLEKAAAKNDWSKAKDAMQHLERVFKKVEIYVHDY